MKFIKKIFSMLIICAMLTPTIVLAENEEYVIYYPDEASYGHSAEADIELFNSNQTDFNSCIEYIINQLKQIPYTDDELPLSIDISKFEIPADSMDEFNQNLSYTIQHKHPELFFLSRYFRVRHNYIVLNSIDMSDIQATDKDGNPIVLHPYTLSKEEIKNRQAIIDAETDKIFPILTTV